jgi:predicted O-methyltransferase YrrM
MYVDSGITQLLTMLTNSFNGSVLRDTLRELRSAAYRHKYLARANHVSVESLVSDRLNQEAVIPLSQWSYGNAPLCDVQAIALLVKRQQPLNLFEFGTFTGQTSLVLMLNASTQSTLWTLDLPQVSRESVAGLHWERDIEEAVVGSTFRNHKCRDRIVQLLEDSLTFDVTPYINTMDLVYVDACHDYEHVKADTEKAVQMCKNGGIVVWHDVNSGCPDVMRLVGEIGKSAPVYVVSYTNVAYMTVNK